MRIYSAANRSCTVKWICDHIESYIMAESSLISCIFITERKLNIPAADGANIWNWIEVDPALDPKMVTLQAR